MSLLERSPPEPAHTPESGCALADLARRARWELDTLSYPARDWVRPRSDHGVNVLDALIVGGGQSGVAIAFQLMRERITNVRILDQSRAGQEGPWRTFARMETLRTPKTVVGPELDIPSLSARAWYEAQFGPNAWQTLGKLPRGVWHDYLTWLRETIGIAITNNACVDGIEPRPDGLLAVRATIAGKYQFMLARNVVLATGVEGCGHWIVPDVISRSLPPRLYAQSSQPIDFTSLTGRRVAVMGSGASAFDNAAMALEHGATAVDIFIRRRELPVVNPNRWMEFSGFLRHFADLDDARKWRFMKTIFEMNQPPPQDTFNRCASHANFTMHTGSPIQEANACADAIILTTPGGAHECDFLIVATGHGVDLAARPELAGFACHIAQWSDRFVPPPGWEHPALGRYPYLSANFQFTEKVPGAAPYLSRIFSYAFAAMPSLASSAGISALKFGVARVTNGITRNLFLDDADHHFQTLCEYREPELTMPSTMSTIMQSGGDR